MLTLPWPNEPLPRGVDAASARKLAFHGATHYSWPEVQSLAQCLRAILAGGGAARPYDEIVAVLGLGSRFRVSQTDCVAEWELIAQDVNLVAAAALYGVQLRELHPPEAAAGLGGSAEYPQHFEDSYVPLIRRALEHGQVCIARRGWPAPNGPAWGVLASADEFGLRGFTIGGERGSVAFVGPAMQVYVVEAFEPSAARSVTSERTVEQAKAAARIEEDSSVGVTSWRALEAVLQGRTAGGNDVLCRFCGLRELNCESVLALHLIGAMHTRKKWFARVTDWTSEAIDRIL